MWGDPAGPTFALQGALPMLALPALRAVAGLLIGFAVSLICGILGMLACLEIERRDRARRTTA